MSPGVARATTGPRMKHALAARQLPLRRTFISWLSKTKAAPDSSDASSGFRVLPTFTRFSQKNEMFCRAFWDEKIANARTRAFFTGYRQPLHEQWNKRGNGFTQADFALRNASWHVVDLLADFVTTITGKLNRRHGFLDDMSVLLRDGPTEKVDLGTPAQAAAHIKHVAKVIGASKVGIAARDDRWTYTHKFDPETLTEKDNDSIPEAAKYVIVVAQTMDQELIKTVPSALSGTATGLGYGHDALVILSLGQHIRNLGYVAVPSMNDTALVIPYAIQAGLGEYGRLGLVITPEFGPRVRLGKIFTDLPLELDKCEHNLAFAAGGAGESFCNPGRRPISFGVKEFCETCNECAKGCPAKAVPFGKPSAAVHNQSNITHLTTRENIAVRVTDRDPAANRNVQQGYMRQLCSQGTRHDTIVVHAQTGIDKWSVDGEKCFKYWTNLNSDCAVCVRVCPYNRGSAWYDHLWRRLAGVSLLRGIMLSAHLRSRGGKRKKPSDWWPKASGTGT